MSSWEPERNSMKKTRLHILAQHAAYTKYISLGTEGIEVFMVQFIWVRTMPYRGLVMYKRPSRENPHWISLSFRQNIHSVPCVLSLTAKSIGGVTSCLSLGSIGQLAVGLSVGAQHVLSSLMIAPCLHGFGGGGSAASEAD